jgi:hypothetical protein
VLFYYFFLFVIEVFLINYYKHLCSRTRKGFGDASLSLPHMQRWLDDWEGASQDVWPQDGPYDEAEYQAYLDWYLPRTRVRVTHAPRNQQRHTPSYADTYPVHRDQATAHAVSSVMLVLQLIYVL